MFNKEVLLGVIQLLGLVGFIILLFFILIAKYIKKDSERKIFIYSFIAISLFLVVWITITSHPIKQVVENNTSTGKLSLNHSSQSIESNYSKDSNITNIDTQHSPSNPSSQVIKSGISIGSNISNTKK